MEPVWASRLRDRSSSSVLPRVVRVTHSKETALVANIPDSSWQDGTMTSADPDAMLPPQVLSNTTGVASRKAAPKALRKLPAVVLVEEQAAPKEEAPS